MERRRQEQISKVIPVTRQGASSWYLIFSRISVVPHPTEIGSSSTDGCISRYTALACGAGEKSKSRSSENAILRGAGRGQKSCNCRNSRNKGISPNEAEAVLSTDRISNSNYAVMRKITFSRDLEVCRGGMLGLARSWCPYTAHR